MQVDTIIVGQGLAGSALALALLQRGQQVLVVDRGDEFAASRVAAGLVTTLAGRGMNPAWRQSEYLPVAMAYYDRLERESGRRLFYPLPVQRLFSGEKEREKFLSKRAEVSEWVGEPFTNNPGGYVKDAFGSFTMARGGRLDTKAYLQLAREMIEREGAYRVGEATTLEFLEDGWIRSCGVRARRILFCQGYAGLAGGYFDWLPHRSAKGEILTVKVEGLVADRIINRNGWMVPQGDGVWRAGATYAWDDLAAGPSAAGEAEVRRKIEELTSAPYEVIGHDVGVRPILQRSQPVIGFHPEYLQLGIFNGLGSKGVISAPAVAAHFAEAICNGIEIDPELDLKRFVRPTGQS